MGCDIHLAIEVRENHLGTWYHVGLNDMIYIPRCYTMFGAMTGGQVRGDSSGLDFTPRGLPDDVTRSVTTNNALYILEDDKYDKSVNKDDLCSTSQAELWVTQHGCEYLDNMGTSSRWVTNPNYHSHSWLITSEFKKVIDKVVKYNKSFGYSKPLHYMAILAMMIEYEKEGWEARIVFWFDN